VKIPYDIRNQHIYVPGKTRHGKSTLLGEMALQDIEQEPIGAGVCVIDPKGDLVSKMLHWIPESRKDDCIYIDPDNPISIDFWDAASPREEETLSDELKHLITKGVSTDSMPLMESIISDVIQTLFEAKKNGLNPAPTVLDIHDFLALPSCRRRVMNCIKSERWKERWSEGNFPNAKDRQPTLTRMNRYVNSEYLKTILGCSKPKLNIARVMDDRKILLVNLGGIDEPSRIFATILVSKIYQAAKRRAKLPESERIPFHLYVDEFEFFQTQDFTNILSFAGGYGLRLTLANQFLSQLDSTIKASIKGNVDSFIIFKLSPEDAREFRYLSDAYYRDDRGNPLPLDLANIHKHWAFYAISGQTKVYAPTKPPRGQSPVSYAPYIRNRMLRDYRCPSGQTPPTPLNSEHGKPDPESTEGTVLPDQKQTPGPSSASGSLRPTEQGSRRSPPKAGTQPKRHPDRKPDP